MLDFDWHLSTPRLYISYANPSNAAHCDFFAEYMYQPAAKKELEELSRTMPRREAVAKLHIEPRLARMEATGYGRYVVALKPDARSYEPIGCVTMQLDRFPGVPGPTVPDVGFSFLDRYQGKGYATEAAKRLMEYFREERGQKGFLGITDQGNEGAKKVLGRLGFSDRGVREVTGVDDGGNAAVVSLWSIDLEGPLEEYGVGKVVAEA
ncbi:ribosomal-protein-alanine acetyltransferase [Colletotrichum plurivorum]|uniref:Ribosomal-protein-alanine acetyltransferase n=1 Tax=Colletotrichum plurivorum TaxID=2175906 RepID=A0A8H6K1F4_9PEZI|nr:ribosomal-protein-alanine acetyltransferase [Colletotrichum plurivorum]